MNYQRLYAYRFRNVPQEGREAVWREIAEYLYERLGRPERILDPAAGRGEFINAVPAAERWAIDQIAHRYGSGVHALVGDALKVELPNDYFGAVMVSNFLEHLTSQEAVASFLERMHESMVEGGLVAIMGPNFRFCANEYFDFADHSVGLSHLAVVEHLYAAGFTPEVVHPRFLPYSFTGRLPHSPRVVRYYLRVPLAWKVLGKQFLVIGRRD